VFTDFIQAPVPTQVIHKGVPTAGLLAHLMAAKFADHLPLYFQEKIFLSCRAVHPPFDLGAVSGQLRRAT